MIEINWTLINELATKSHPLLYVQDDHRHDCCPYDGETQQQARTVHHLLDIVGTPRGVGYSSDVDVRTYLLVAETLELRERLSRISDWHSRETGSSGMVGDFCTKCGEIWPCDTRRMTDGSIDLSETTSTGAAS